RFPSSGVFGFPALKWGEKEFKSLDAIKEVVPADHFVKVTSPYATPAAELAALDKAFGGMVQISYYAPLGPNSNTFLRQLLSNAGFTPPTSPPDATGWDYVGNYGYGVLYFDKNGYATSYYAARIVVRSGLGAAGGPAL